MKSTIEDIQNYDEVDNTLLPDSIEEEKEQTFIHPHHFHPSSLSDSG